MHLPFRVRVIFKCLNANKSLLLSYTLKANKISSHKGEMSPLLRDCSSQLTSILVWFILSTLTLIHSTCDKSFHKHHT